MTSDDLEQYKVYADIHGGAPGVGRQSTVGLSTTFLAISVTTSSETLEKARIIFCSLQTNTNKKAVLWQKNRAMPL